MSTVEYRGSNPRRGHAGPAPACTLIIFGATGDLTKRLLMPALYNLSGSRLLDDSFSVIGVGRAPGSDADFRSRQKSMMESFTLSAGGEFAEKSLDETAWSWLERRLHYLSGDFGKQETFEQLAKMLGDGSCIFYLAVPAQFFGKIVDRLVATDLMKEHPGRFRRVVIEKPFGHDLASAEELNRHLLRELNEDQIYRIDHFLGKETVQNIMALRLSNLMIESLWNRNHIESVQITAAETVGVESRGSFYEATGALRDMVPNHLFQLLSLVTMGLPNSFDADALRNEKAKVIEAIHPMTAQEVENNVVRGQYFAGRVDLPDGSHDVTGYTNEKDVAPESRVETFVALKLMIENWRWAGVPFYLRTGKRMGARTTEIAITFKQVPMSAFRDTPAAGLCPNVMVLHLQPAEGISLQFNAKEPGQSMALRPVQMDFKYEDFFKMKPATGYETRRALN